MDRNNNKKWQDSFKTLFILFIPILCIPVLLFFRCLIITSVQEILGLAGLLMQVLLLLCVYAAYGILFIKCIVWTIRRRRGDKWSLICSVAAVLAAVYLSMVFPFTSMYARIHYSFYKSDLILAAEAATSNNLRDHYRQVGETEYLLPNQFASFSGSMFIERHRCSSHVYFYTYRGLLGNTYLVYSSDGSPPENKFSSYRETKRLFENWYFVLER